jgi:hypothetical protein
LIYFCCDKNRRALIEGSSLNGIDYLEVRDREAPTPKERQRILFVYFIKPLAPDALKKENVRIDGGVRIRNIKAVKAKRDKVKHHLLIVEVDRAGDYSTYGLRLIREGDQSAEYPRTPDGFDPQLSSVEFTFKIECPSDFDCAKKTVCIPTHIDNPDINYLAKDYSSFRRLMLDRLRVLMPDWKERNPADLQVALVELLAYTGDLLSYQQDAIATEAYLGTARKRISVRRHARLVDYLMHDGWNARTWVQVQVNTDNVVLPLSTKLLTRLPGQVVGIPGETAEYDQAMQAKPEVFETMHDVLLFQSHNEIRFYTWGDAQCCLPKGATRAYLRDDAAARLRLCKEDVLIFEEKRGPVTNMESDANRRKRQAVRLTRVYPEATPIRKDGKEIERTPGNLQKDSATGAAYVEIEWAQGDSLRFPFCISTKSHDDVSVARGNIVLADHGNTVDKPKQLVKLSQPAFAFRSESLQAHCEECTAQPATPRVKYRLQDGPLTQAATIVKRTTVNGVRREERIPFDPEAPAAEAFSWKMEDVLPAITLNDRAWRPQRDLLNSGPYAKEFVVEVEEDGTSMIRFGDGINGLQPKDETEFTASYRVGNGVRGNVGAETLAHIVNNNSAIISVRNPLPAKCGKEPETREEVQLLAPHAFRRQERAVTEADYAEAAQKHPEVQKAVATFRWTGSWHTVFVTIDRKGGRTVDADFEVAMRDHLEKYRLAGFDIEIDGPIPAPLDLVLTVCIKPGYFRSDVKQALLDAFSSRDREDGSRGFFHPDNFTFGQPAYLSQIYKTAMDVDGVEWVGASRFQRLDKKQEKELELGVLTVERLEIIRLDNDPNFPENGKLRFEMKGGL